MCSASGSSAKKTWSHTLFALPLLLSALIPHFLSPSAFLCLYTVTSPPFTNLLQKLYDILSHKSQTVVSRTEFPGKGQEHTVLRSGVTTCFIKSNEGAAEVTESKCAGRNVPWMIWSHEVSVMEEIISTFRYSSDYFALS